MRRSSSVRERTSAVISYQPSSSASISRAYGCWLWWAGSSAGGGSGSLTRRPRTRPGTRQADGRRAHRPVRAAGGASQADHAPGQYRRRLIERMVTRRRELRTAEVLLPRVIPEPGLARLVALDDRMLDVERMAARVLRGRRVAAADVAAMGAPAQVEPPATGCQALDAAGTARRDRGIDVVRVRHSCHLLREGTLRGALRCPLRRGRRMGRPISISPPGRSAQSVPARGCPDPVRWGSPNAARRSADGIT